MSHTETHNHIQKHSTHPYRFGLILGQNVQYQEHMELD